MSANRSKLSRASSRNVRPAKPARFALKPAAEMVRGESCVPFTQADVDRGHPYASRVADIGKGRSRNGYTLTTWDGPDNGRGLVYVCALARIES